MTQHEKVTASRKKPLLLVAGIIFISLLVLLLTKNNFTSKLLPQKAASQPTAGVEMTEEMLEAQGHEGYEEPEEKDVVTIKLENGTITPEQTTIKVETVVGFYNDDKIDHHMVSEGEEGFDSGVLKPETKLAVKEFEKAGTYTYHCKLHPDEEGTIIVEK